MDENKIYELLYRDYYSELNNFNTLRVGDYYVKVFKENPNNIYVISGGGELFRKNTFEDFVDLLKNVLPSGNIIVEYKF
jgi:hypothetical protein